MAPMSTEEQDKASMLKERRFKLSRACDRCRRRRIKCDEGHPCQACISASSACTFEEPGKRTNPHKSKRTATLEDRMHHLETLIQAIPPAVFAAGGASESPITPTTQPVFDLSAHSLASMTSKSHVYPSGVPPPSLHVFPLTNPSNHFTHVSKSGEMDQSPSAAFRLLLGQQIPQNTNIASPSTEQLAEEIAHMSVSASYLYFDDEGYTRWQGETSGLPLLDLMLERHRQPSSQDHKNSGPSSPEVLTSSLNSSGTQSDWFPNRTPKRSDVNAETLWRLITSHIVPDLMDSLVQCYLSTSYYILPFLHVPTFLADYGNPQKWAEPGFAAFIIAICCLSSRHTDDPRVRSDPSDGVSAGTQWFELLGRLRTLPIADRPTLYTIQADLIAAVYALGLGKLSKAAALVSEAITVSIDAGLHRSADSYDLFDPIEDEVRKRTFWCVYIWDKQLGAHFGRPPMIRLKDCDVGEPAVVDDEFITRDAIGTQPAGVESRMSAFVCSIRILVVLEGVIGIPPARHPTESSPFLLRAASVFSQRKRHTDLREEEAMLDEIHRSIPPHWAHSTETLASGDVIRVTQAERLHCAEHFVRMLIHRHRLSELVAEKRGGGTGDEEQSDQERETVSCAYSSALQIIAAHLHVATKGLMTYYGVHVVHQLAQAGRTLVAVLLNCKSEPLQSIIPEALEALRSCVGLLRRFSGRYVCGLRSGDLMEEFCRLTQIPLETPGHSSPAPDSHRPPWIRPVPKKNPPPPRSSHSSVDSVSQRSSPGADPFSPSDYLNDMSTGMTPNSTVMYSPITAVNSSPIDVQSSFSSQGYGHNSGNMMTGAGSPYMSTSNGIGISDNMMSTDEVMYMSPEEVMALFQDGGVDMGSLFPSDFTRQLEGAQRPLV